MLCGVKATVGSNPTATAIVMWRDIVRSMSRHFCCFGAGVLRVFVRFFVLVLRVIVRLCCASLFVWLWFFWLVVFVGVDLVFCEDFSGFAVDDHGVGS